MMLWNFLNTEKTSFRNFSFLGVSDYFSKVHNMKKQPHFFQACVAKQLLKKKNFDSNESVFQQCFTLERKGYAVGIAIIFLVSMGRTFSMTQKSRRFF